MREAASLAATAADNACPSGTGPPPPLPWSATLGAGHHEDVVAVADAAAGRRGELGEIGERARPELAAAQALGQQLLALGPRTQPVGERGQHGVRSGPGPARRGTARPVARRVVSLHVLSSERLCGARADPDGRSLRESGVFGF